MGHAPRHRAFVFAVVLLVDFERRWSLAYTQARAERCVRDYQANGTMYMETKTMPDGHQREMTPVEKQVMFRWMRNELAYMKLPSFFKETMHSDERAHYATYMREQLGHRVYGRIPAGLKLPMTRTETHFGAALI